MTESLASPPPAVDAVSPAAFLDQARAGLKIVARFLERPNAESLEHATRCLGVIASQLQSGRAAAARDPGNADLERAREELACELAHVQTMYREGGAVFGGWKRLLSSRLGGYMRNGRPAPLRCQRNVAFKV